MKSMIEFMAFRLRIRKDRAMITFQDILTWKSGGLRAFRSVLVKNARDLEQVHDESQRLFTDKFLGACAEAEELIMREAAAIVNALGLAYKTLEDLQERAEAPSAAIL